MSNVLRFVKIAQPPRPSATQGLLLAAVGHASPTELAHDLGLSPAGMTGRLDALEAKGYLRRVRDDDDRRRVDIEVTTTGFALWQKAMRMRGDSEDSVFAALTRTELHTLNRLLKKLTLAAGDPS